ncbi:tRNA adenosine(34) deaminase TadA [bacterium (Candidatus Blackallbacteria) CG17_big_fil_post_rev_8_21_14_2_50_48_46]|uniref:tRNA adenosine(34) deaminase TadA n=1 Tax=bacterium (Candidatus Blackallbacteria) CG17_big_fil_post_rev_8_21_14_2_50_48_46 TaxID=2014261 RepID=A0A2M7G4U9_9BACT|nr:MAG: tRNA-specific adenosine deaminase [bacterium (Candidatus Blackallbacteria) CG18_big_fil_WC_8_21_14_2_50_49_26]PIW16963.1 MAG: tRNA adenosine(34) deaminase TadA [bacterium (Candidatus Blackallbacteria) CG17_big_fil_post_rev_8_21_14_2_50_48_46]PIW50242.1 MAG: tRNA adenosine(34) deaminase TadA [bacterium (Candidatus Blackallbacteria) CG13_big_fil_rev_8_21_14_2_50_49_14]
MRDDRAFLNRAVELAQEAEAAGNMPIGSLIVLDGEIIAEGRNALLVPVYNPGGHGEIEAIKRVPAALWPRAAEMTCYSSLEPCLMCFGSLLLHGVGRIVFGALDLEGGAGCIQNHLPPYYPKVAPAPLWEGPLLPERCDPLYHRARARFISLPCGGNHPSTEDATQDSLQSH